MKKLNKSFKNVFTQIFNINTSRNMEWKTKVGTYIKKITFNNNIIKGRKNKTIKSEYIFLKCFHNKM